MAKLFSKANRRKLLAWILPPIIYVFIKLLYFTCKKKFHIKEYGSITPSIYAIWHGELLMVAFAYAYYSKRQKIDTIVILQPEKAIPIYGEKGKKGVVIITIKK